MPQFGRTKVLKAAALISSDHLGRAIAPFFSFITMTLLNDKQIASFQEDLSALGYKYQFITLAGIHINWFNTFQFAHAYANGEGMKHYVNMVQEPEFAAREQGYTFVSHQQEVGAGYFDDVTTVIQGGSSSVKALSGSTEEEQFH